MIVLNERRWAEHVLNTGDLGDSPYATVYMLARYFYHVEGLKRKKIMEKLDSLLSQLIADYNPVKWENVIEKAATQAKKRPLIEIPEITVNKGEIEFIKALKGMPLQRLAFTMIVIAKYFNILKETNNNWVNLELKQVFQLACVSATVKEQAKMYRKLIDADFMEYSKKVGNNNARVLILDDSEPEVYVDDMRAIGHFYQVYCGEPYTKCERCGVLIRQNKFGNKKYCADCAKAPSPGMRKFTCIDCGKEVFVVSRNAWSCRCESCQTEARKQEYRESKRRIRNNMSTALPEENS